jgi:hypothetical protein
VTARLLLAAVVSGLACAAALAPAGGATQECRGIVECIRVAGPWVVVPPHGHAQYLLSCPRGQSIVGGLDALATSRSVRLSFDGRLGSPVAPGVTTTTTALFRGVSTSHRREAFQPRLGCVPTAGGGGRSTVSARTTPPGPSLELRAKIVIIGPGSVRFARIACRPGEKLVGSWDAIAFRTKQPPALANAGLVHVSRVVAGKNVVVTASSTDLLSIDAHAVVQVGAECAP